MRPKRKRRCEHCNQPLPVPSRSDMRFCNGICRSANGRRQGGDSICPRCEKPGKPTSKGLVRAHWVKGVPCPGGGQAAKPKSARSALEPR